MARTKRGETGDTPYQEFTRTGGVPVRAWTRGVLFEDAAQRQLLNIARLPFVHSHVAATNGAQEDWIALLDALLKGDRVALAKVTAVITGWLAHYRAYDFRDSWDDFIHEVLIRLIQSARRGAIREPSAFISYVGKITRNLFLDWIGPENRHRDLPERLQTDVESRVPDLLLDLKRALEDLPDELRRVVEAIYLQGHTYEEAAKLLDVPLGTLKRRLTQARKEIRKKMGIDGESS